MSGWITVILMTGLLVTTGCRERRVSVTQNKTISEAYKSLNWYQDLNTLYSPQMMLLESIITALRENISNWPVTYYYQASQSSNDLTRIPNPYVDSARGKPIYFKMIDSAQYVYRTSLSKGTDQKSLNVTVETYDLNNLRSSKSSVILPYAFLNDKKDFMSQFQQNSPVLHDFISREYRAHGDKRPKNENTFQETFRLAAVYGIIGFLEGAILSGNKLQKDVNVGNIFVSCGALLFTKETKQTEMRKRVEDFLSETHKLLKSPKP